METKTQPIRQRSLHNFEFMSEPGKGSSGKISTSKSFYLEGWVKLTQPLDIDINLAMLKSICFEILYLGLWIIDVKSSVFKVWISIFFHSFNL